MIKHFFFFGAILFSAALASISASADYCNGGSGGRNVIPVDRSEGKNEDYGDYDHIPWQPSPSNVQNIDEAARYEDMPPSVFSPTGRLHPVEAAVTATKAVTNLSNLLLAMRCREGLLVISTLPISPHVDTRIANVSADANVTALSKHDSTHSSTGNSNRSLYPSLFLLDETCSSTITAPIFDIHPCIIGATAGNAVDNRIMRTKLLTLGLNSLQNQGTADDDVVAGRIAKELANQLQVLTQDIAAAKKQRLGRILASSAVILGNQKIWRIDPTGQFWDCQAAVLGEDADRTEEALYRRLQEKCESNGFGDISELLDSMSQGDAFAFVEDFLRIRMIKKQSSRSFQPSIATKPSLDNTESSAKKIDEPTAPDSSTHVYWQAAILDYTSMKRCGTPRRKLKRGIFGVRKPQRE